MLSPGGKLPDVTVKGGATLVLIATEFDWKGVRLSGSARRARRRNIAGTSHTFLVEVAGACSRNEHDRPDGGDGEQKKKATDWTHVSSATASLYPARP